MGSRVLVGLATGRELVEKFIGEFVTGRDCAVALTSGLVDGLILVLELPLIAPGAEDLVGKSMRVLDRGD